MTNPRKLLIGLIAITVLLAAPLPLLYPLVVAGAACCEQRLARRDALLVAVAISVAILTGTALTQAGLLPLAGPWRVNGRSLWSGWPSWGLAAASAVAVWAVVIRSPRSAGSPGSTTAEFTASGLTTTGLELADSGDFLPPVVSEFGAVDRRRPAVDRSLAND